MEKRERQRAGQGCSPGARRQTGALASPETRINVYSPISFSSSSCSPSGPATGCQHATEVHRQQGWHADKAGIARVRSSSGRQLC
ncbi:unnamed protein product [Arctogadus glacialis]